MGAIYTAGYLYVGQDRLDITRRGTSRQARRGRPAPGAILAPSWLILGPALVQMRAAANRAEKERVFADYERLYLKEMDYRFDRQSQQWLPLIERETLTLVCFCAEPDFCHRRLAAVKLAAASEGCMTYEGERPKPPSIAPPQKPRDLWNLV